MVGSNEGLKLIWLSLVMLVRSSIWMCRHDTLVPSMILSREAFASVSLVSSRSSCIQHLWEYLRTHKLDKRDAVAFSIIMADNLKTSSTYSEVSFVTTKNDLKHKFYRPDVSEMIVPVVNCHKGPNTLMRCLMNIADKDTPQQLQSYPSRCATYTRRSDRK